MQGKAKIDTLFGTALSMEHKLTPCMVKATEGIVHVACRLGGMSASMSLAHLRPAHVARFRRIPHASCPGATEREGGGGQQVLRALTVVLAAARRRGGRLSLQRRCRPPDEQGSAPRQLGAPAEVGEASALLLRLLEPVCAPAKRRAAHSHCC